MTLKADGRTTDATVVDRWGGGAGWIAYPHEKMQRTSHLLEDDGEVWLVDPLDAPLLDDLIGEYGEVEGIVVLLDRHTRDAADLADRYDVPVYVPTGVSGVTGLDAPIKPFSGDLPGTDVTAVSLVDLPMWSEAALYDDRSGTLVVADALGTAPYFTVNEERLGVHPLLRLKPPNGLLNNLAPGRVLVGHGEGVTDDATAALRTALSDARRRAPELYAKNIRSMVPSV